MFRRMITLVVVASLAAVAACSSAAAPQCRVGADCASGACDSSGRCVPVSASGQDAGDGGDDASVGQDAGTDGDAHFAHDAPGGCVADGDGVVQRGEVPLYAGLHASFVIAENVTIDTAGTSQPGGSRTWDLSGALSGDHTVVVTTDSPAGQWYASQFSTATYVSKLSDTQDLLGVFQAASDGLRLQGVVSPSSGAQQTQLSYSPAAETFAFPMQVGTSWSTNAQVSGTAMGVPSAYAESWQSNVDAHGSMKVPFGTFDVLRVKTTLTRTVGATVTVIRSFAWVAECFGAIAAATSQYDETNAEFANAAEVRRLAQ